MTPAQTRRRDLARAATVAVLAAGIIILGKLSILGMVVISDAVSGR
jgi:hypothetical protein